MQKDPLYVVALKGNVSQLESLDLEAVDSNSLNESLMYAQQVEVMYNLLEAGANPVYGESISLVIASRMGAISSVNLLLANGADACCNNGAAIMAATENGRYQVLEILLKQAGTETFKEEALELAQRYKQVKCIELLS